MDDLAAVTTERLEQRRPVEEDLDEVHALHADPGVGEHLPSGCDVRLAHADHPVPDRALALLVRS
ncbi:hypothetical protein WDZ16_01010 [Pseudokineococcus marinus]|uniref:Uncharacterized protein n=1 Tax=Pseudokineococcus marinus TaxID=351215 RepID=A0A849BPU5_9ACTN|nr:hypothetical protein [Pseudokineococcus marinus]NNH23383.1 hypothetical protein [Pseudokineococcus marinus]